MNKEGLVQIAWPKTVVGNKPGGMLKKQWLNCIKEDDKQMDLNVEDGRCLHNDMTTADGIRGRKSFYRTFAFFFQKMEDL